MIRSPNLLVSDTAAMVEMAKKVNREKKAKEEKEKVIMKTPVLEVTEKMRMVIKEMMRTNRRKLIKMQTKENQVKLKRRRMR